MSDNIFTNYRLTRYYSVVTIQVCGNCGKTAQSLPHPQINVEAQCGESKKVISLEELMNRYKVLFNLNEEQARDVLPKLPYELITYQMPKLPRCNNCMAFTLGIDSPSAMPPMLPVETSGLTGPVFGGNLEQAKAKPSSKAKPRPTLDSLFNQL